MPRIRTIKPEFFTSEQIADCSPIARLLFIGMWCFCDDAGIHPASLKSIKMQVFPGDDISIPALQKFINELINGKLLIQYEVNGSSYWQVTGWKHQKIDKPNYKYPPFNDSATIRRPIDDSSPPETKGRESSLKDSKEGPLYPPAFDQFWFLFPKQRRGSIEKTYAAWKRATTRATEETIYAGLQTYAISDEVKRGFAKGAEGWLNDDRWKCDYSIKPEPRPAHGTQPSKRDRAKAAVIQAAIDGGYAPPGV